MTIGSLALLCAGTLMQVDKVLASAAGAVLPARHGPDTSYATGPLVWRNMGPAHVNGGLVADIAVPMPRSAHEPRAGTTMYIAGPGGLFKTVDAGRRWTPLG